MSLAISYWMVGAFFMAMKRYAEYRHIGDPEVAAAYRASFAYYTEERLLISLFFYATTCALFAGIFIVRYHLELILFAPLAAGLFAYYMKLGLAARQPGAESGEALPAARLPRVPDRLHGGVRRPDVHEHPEHVRRCSTSSRPA